MLKILVLSADRLGQALPNHVSMSVVELAALGNQAIGQIKLFQQTWLIREEYFDENHPLDGCKMSYFWA